MTKENTLKISIPFEGLKITLWKMIKKDPNYIMFNASIVSSKKNEDGTWLNETNYITCFARETAMNKIKEIYEEKKKILINGNLSLKPEKKEITDKDGKTIKDKDGKDIYKAIYTEPVYNIKSFEELGEDGKTIHYKSKSSNDKSQINNEDIPF